ncbi:hypothetical protein SAMN05877753_106245 [Bacillus oleivorans]|uniref:6-hydroxymethylpterin diphosphokinase MptE-like domain-containing protein n=1 Tax=Bacillus oleivorans TaxID=1448271 RepID=A0A285CZC1_9BACI|nr:6-hydroxymethylpterin diphosphokinase MptE-like protein [Bacillus oleivorans]SNX72904.1 hypothetical protein SAMN05877753_106245 [Bacillus oleivorans]
MCNNYKIEKIKEFDETFFVYNELKNNRKIHLNSTFSSEKEAEKFINQIKSDQLNIVIGIGNGAFLKKLKNNDFIHCLIIEPFEDVILDESTIEIIKNSDNISFYYLKDITSLIINGYIKRFLGLYSNILIHPRYEKTNSDLLNKIISIVKDGSIMLRVNKNTEKYFKKDWIIEPLLNLEYTLAHSSLGEFKDKFAGETALLVASGPSLNENIPFIKKVKDKVHIFAAGSALKGLLSNNITPDFVTVMDSSIKNFTSHFKEVNYTGTLIVSGMANSNIIKNHGGPFILANLNIDSITTRFRKEVPAFPSVPSVSVFTLQILYYLGFSKVYLIGQDLALINGEYYSKGVTVHQNTNNFEAQLFVDGNNGSKVATLYLLYAHLQSFNDIVGLLDKERIKIYNLSRNGAKIKGVEYVPVESVNIFGGKRQIITEDILHKNTGKYTDTIKLFVTEITNAQKKVNEILKKLNKLNINAVSLDDLKRVLKLFKELRSQKIIEEIFLKQLSFYVQKLNNKFEYTFEKEIVSNQDRIEMVKDIIGLVEEIQKYLKEVLEDDRIKIYQ